MIPANKQVEDFLNTIKKDDAEKFEIINLLREIVVATCKDVNETIKYGGILFSLNDNFGGLFVSKNHISFEFTFGYKLDTELNLEGSGKFRRHIKFKNLTEVELARKELKQLLKQIINIDKETVK